MKGTKTTRDQQRKIQCLFVHVRLYLFKCPPFSLRHHLHHKQNGNSTNCCVQEKCTWSKANEENYSFLYSISYMLYKTQNQLCCHAIKLCYIPGLLQVMRKLKVRETTHDPNQFTRVTKLPAMPLMLMGNIYVKIHEHNEIRNRYAGVCTVEQPNPCIIRYIFIYLRHHNPWNCTHSQRE